MSNSLKLKDIKFGQSFYESERGSDIHWVAMEDAKRVDEKKQNGWRCRCIAPDGTEMELFEAIKCYQYGLRLYSSPQYLNPHPGFLHHEFQSSKEVEK